MDVINDKIVNVPISDDDIIKNVTSLPRTKETNGFVNLKMKRRLQYKHYYKMETVRPEMVYKALLFLIYARWEAARPLRISDNQFICF